MASAFCMAIPKAFCTCCLKAPRVPLDLASSSCLSSSDTWPRSKEGPKEKSNSTCPAKTF
eukprot:9816596-Prorocentrum_lima.AAC.1